MNVSAIYCMRCVCAFIRVFIEKSICFKRNDNFDRMLEISTKRIFTYLARDREHLDTRSVCEFSRILNQPNFSEETKRDNSNRRLCTPHMFFAWISSNRAAETRGAERFTFFFSPLFLGHARSFKGLWPVNRGSRASIAHVPVIMQREGCSVNST